jgi:hypothetical protein
MNGKSPNNTSKWQLGFNSAFKGLRSDLNWDDQVNYRVQKAWKSHYFVMRVLKKGNRNTKSLAYMSLVRPVLEYWCACWHPCRGQINALDRA